MFGEYCFFVASRIGADCRVMGIALAVEPLQVWGGFFVCTKRFIPSVSRGSSPRRLDQVSSASAPVCLAFFYFVNCVPPLGAVAQGRALVQESQF